MTKTLDELRQIYKKLYPQAIQDYFTFLKFATVSSDPAYENSMTECVNWLSSYIKKMGLDVEIWKTEKYPVIYASSMKAGPGKPTLLIYNHYDVQPVDPLEKWVSPPFEPTIRDGNVFARGAQDNKGQCFYTLLALKTILEHGELPINIKLCIEGEEESGSEGLSSILKSKEKELKADYIAVIDLGIPSPDRPAISLGLRGIVALDIEVQGSSTDLHSGMHGGLAYNPIHALVQILTALRDPSSGKIQVPGFYDDVINLSSKEKANLALRFDEKEYEKAFGIKPTGGERELMPLERNWLRPTLEINGVYGGYSGAGVKTVIPATAGAKITCRLVPNQNPQRIGSKIKNYIEKNVPRGVSVNVSVHNGGGVAVRTDPNTPMVQTFAKAYAEIYQKPCEFIFDGGSIPIISELANASGGQVVLLGIGYPGDKIHAPNEHFGVDRLETGFLIVSRALSSFGVT